MKVVKKFLPFVVLGCLVYFMATRVDWPATTLALKSIPIGVLVGAVALNMIAAVTLVTVNFSLVAHVSKFRCLARIEGINSRVLGLSTILPTALVAAYKVREFQKVLESTSKSLAFFLLVKLSSVLVAISVIFFFGFKGLSVNADIFESTTFTIALSCVIFAGCLGVFPSIRGRVKDSVAGILPEKVKNALSSGASLLGFKSWGWGVSTQAVAFLLVIASTWLIAFSINGEIPLTALLIGRATTILALLVPISVAGVGAREVSFLAVLPVFGVGASDAITLVLILLLVQWMTGLLGFGYSVLLSKLAKD